VNPTSITVSLVPEARGGPFVYWDPLPESCRKAKAAGFDAIELFAAELDPKALGPALRDHGLRLAAAGTGAGWVLRKLTLTSPDAAVRRQARDFVLGFIDAAAEFGAPAILGSLQGRWGAGVERATALGWLRDAVADFDARADARGVPFLLEPLNRYEGNVLNTLEEGAELLRAIGAKRTTLLADLFHMNIEEADVAGAIRRAGAQVGHVQLADSNRRPAGQGHTDFAAVAAALREIGYRGYLSAEALPWPDPDGAAKLAREAIRRTFSC
jgi:sugar phosphate isomerase/epimerase